MPDRRRSLTIREENDKKIQNIRAKFLYSNIDIDYTTMANIFIELGDLILRQNENGIVPIDVANIFMKYTDNTNIDIISQILENYRISIQNSQNHS